MPTDIDRLTQEVEHAQERLRAALKALPVEPVKDYEFAAAGSGAAVRLSRLFGGKSDLIIVHNMGRKCRYCTLWADGFAGVYRHVSDRAAFVLASPDDPVTAAAFAASRHWPFPVVSVAGTSFSKDMGNETDTGGVKPGISAFHKGADRAIVRARRSQQLGPGDPFSPVWPLLDLLKDGAAGWEPKFHYA